MPVSANVRVHESSYVDDNVEIGDGTQIWHFCHISSGARIGKNCRFGQNVFIAPRVEIGNSVKIQNNVSVYEGVILEDYVFCGPSMVFTNVYNPRSAVTRKHDYRPTLVKKGATLGANCTIVCGVTIGEHAFVGAGAVINSDVKPHALMVGVPAHQAGWMSAHGERIPLPLKGSGQYRCPHSGALYELNEETLAMVTG